MKQIVDAKTILKNRDLLSVLAESVYNPTEESNHNQRTDWCRKIYCRKIAL